MELRARTTVLIGVGSVLVFVALVVGIAVAISWEIAPRVYAVDAAVEQQVMKDLEPWSDEVMAIERCRLGVRIGADLPGATTS